jgi:CRISPR/Cas system CSM-associated protein Csm2 small subunit
LYGGTADFGKGVLDDADNFLTGNHNSRLEEMFSPLWEETFKLIMELSGNRESEEFQHLVQILALQLRLFYNVTGCQQNEVLDASGELLKRLLEQIIFILRNLRERDIKLPESFRPFLEEWAKRVAGKGILEEHVKIILDNNLV